MLFEPFVGQVLGDDCEDVNLRFGHVVVNAEVVHAEAILRLPETPEPLAASLAFFAWLMPKVNFNGRSDAGSIHGVEALKVCDGFGSENDFIDHSGQNMARIVHPVKRVRKRLVFPARRVVIA